MSKASIIVDCPCCGQALRWALEEPRVVRIGPVQMTRYQPVATMRLVEDCPCGELRHAICAWCGKCPTHCECRKDVSKGTLTLPGVPDIV